MKNFKNWRKRLESFSQDSLLNNFIKRVPNQLPALEPEKCLPKNFNKKPFKERKPRPKKTIQEIEDMNIFIAEPKIVFFTNYVPGEIYCVNFFIN